MLTKQICILILRQSRKAFGNVSQNIKRSSNVSLLTHNQHKFFHSTSKCLGLEEFFDDPKNFGKQSVKSGCVWSKDLLRLKNTADLQKLWFVLLKERNMLQTLELNCINEDEPMPGEERLEKVAESMSNLRDVLEEREKARNMLLYGRETKEGGEYRKSALNFTYWYQYKEHLLPKELNKSYNKGDQPHDIASFHPKLEEWHLRMDERRIKKLQVHFKKIAMKWSHLQKNNRNLPKRVPQWYRNRFKCKFRYGIHEELPVITKPYDYRFFDNKKGWRQK